MLLYSSFQVLQYFFQKVLNNTLYNIYNIQYICGNELWSIECSSRTNIWFKKTGINASVIVTHQDFARQLFEMTLKLVSKFVRV